MRNENYRDLRSPVIPLDGLDKEQLLEVSYNLREIHSKVYSWDAAEKFNDQLLEEFVKEMINILNVNNKVNPRTFLKALINKLDRLQQNPDYKISNL